MDLTTMFNKIWEVIRTNENYIPRNHQTIGGMWTVDTWKKDDVIVQLMDEGYTQRILTKELDVTQAYRFNKNVVEFKKGNAEILEKLLKTYLQN